MLVCVCVCVCVRTRVCAKARQLLLGSKSHFLSGSGSIPPALTASRLPSLPPMRPFSASSVAASRAPAASSHSFSVSSRESDRLHFSDKSSK